MDDRQNGFRVIDVELNDVNGGSFSITAAKAGSSYREDSSTIDCILSEKKRKI